MSDPETFNKIEYKFRHTITQSVDGVCMVDISYKADILSPAQAVLAFDAMVKALKEKGYPVAGSPEAAELRKKK